MAISKRWIFESLLWGLLLAALFTLGWWRGRAPESAGQRWWGRPTPLVILTPDPSWIPSDFLKDLAADADLELHIEPIDAYTAFEARLVPLDAPALVWIPLSWARSLAAQGLLASLKGKGVLGKIHRDFRAATSDGTYVPMLWALKGSDLHVEGLAIPANGKDRVAAERVLARWSSPEHATAQVRAVDAASTLTFSNQSDLPFAKRAESLRNLSLKNIRGW